MNQERIDQAIDNSLLKINENQELFRDLFPAAASTNNVYTSVENNKGWTQSFWTGMVWLAYELTGKDTYSSLATHHSKLFKYRIDNNLGLDTHDIGFLYSLSCVADYKISKNADAKETALKAADALLIRWKDKGQFLQAWGDINDPSNYRLIIDCYMNLPLLFWASEVTGNDEYKEKALAHALTAEKVVLRENHSTYHTYYFDPESGEPTQGVTAQGHADDSCWSRGQAWAIYGFALCYKYTKNQSFIESFKKVTDYFLANLPSDKVAYWDLCFTDGEEERDSSAAAIAVCGILEMVKHMQDTLEKEKYTNEAHEILKSLIENYTTFDDPKANGLLFHSVYSKPHNNGIDEMTIWGDYYFLEALARAKLDWNPYW